MASSPSDSQPETAVVEQVITEFFAKSLHIILESRSPYVSSRNYSGEQFASSPSSSSSSSSVRPRDKWFNLALRDCPAALENFDLWRQSNLDPLVIDIVLVRRSSLPELSPRPPPGGCLLRNLSNCWSPEFKSERIIERWIIQYESRSRRSSGLTSEMPAMYKWTYRRSIVSLRSLYVTVRLLPAYKLFRDLNSSGKLRPFSLAHRISSFVEPFTRREDAEMNQFSFAPVETPCGRLCLSVSYVPTLEDMSSEPSAPLCTHFIPDYVGSPTTEPLKRFQSLPKAGSLPTYISFARRHSWSNDRGAMPSESASPSPTYSDSRALQCNQNPNLPPRCRPHDNYPTGCSVPNNPSLTHKKNMSFDEYWPSSSFSPTSPPSTPNHLVGSNLANALLRTESAPVSIALPRPGRSGALLSQALAPPSPKGTRHRSSCQVDIVRAQATLGSQTFAPESKLQPRKEPLKLGELQSSMGLQKVFSFGRDEVGSLPGLKLSSCSSPRITFSRSSSRLSLLDEFDDPEFACPFAPDDEDVSDSCNRVEHFDGKEHPSENLEAGAMIAVRKSQDAAVGVLVKMLKTAPPLRQDLSTLIRSSQVLKEESLNQRTESNKVIEVAEGRVQCAASSSQMPASGLFKSRTAADALEELKSYRKMKDSLLTQSGCQSLDDGQEEKPARRGSSEL